MAAKECLDFGLLRDVVDGHKHVELTRRSKKVTHYSQTKEETNGGFFPPNYFASNYFGRGYFSPMPRFVVTLDDGSKRDLSTILENVFNMWKDLLGRMGL